MTTYFPSSRQQFEKYKADLIAARDGRLHGKHSQRRERSSLSLIRSFFGMLIRCELGPERFEVARIEQFAFSNDV